MAVQPDDSAFPDPWSELAHPSSTSRYRDRIRTMIRRLRDELRAEVRAAEKQIGRGESIGDVLKARNERISPLGCYIVARRAGCVELAGRFRPAAIEQHRSCPLYQPASRSLLAPELYPVQEGEPGGEPGDLSHPLIPQVSLN